MSRKVIDEKIIDMCIANLKRGDDKQEVSAILGALDSGNYGYLVKCLVEEISCGASVECFGEEESSLESSVQVNDCSFPREAGRPAKYCFPYGLIPGESTFYSGSKEILKAARNAIGSKAIRIGWEVKTRIYPTEQDGVYRLQVTRTA